MTTQPEPFTYTDPYGDDLRISAQVPVGGTTPAVTVAAIEADDLVYVPLADVERVVAAIRTAAGQPAADRAALRDRMAEALRGAACEGGCGDTEEECVRRRVQPCVWHHGVLAEVLGTPEVIADAVLAVLPEPDTLLEAVADKAESFRGDWGIVANWLRSLAHDPGLLRRLADEAQQPGALPRRGDVFEQWLKAQRDEYHQTTSSEWRALDEALDTYRLHADTGTPLGEHVCEGQAVGDCECLEQQPTAGEQPDERRERYAAAIVEAQQVADTSHPLSADRYALAAIAVADQEQAALRARVAELDRRAAELEQRVAASAARPGGQAEDGAQQPQTADSDASPTAQLLATRCDACRHTLNHHTHHGACGVVLCVCGTFQYPAEEN
ncbi:hypothetical protein [Streptomyces scopuliridis]|uniref:hypothetical protein n=1 Tax=Streptomyces scopuliridis TaxID=452529 RepID=UPI003414EC27